MKALTHYVFSAGAGLYVLSLTQQDRVLSFLMVLWLSFAVNLLIDAIGHGRGRSGNPSRTRATHSIFTAPVWGGATGLLSVYAMQQAGLTYMSAYQLLFWSLGGALMALGHLFLDSLTQAGVYYWKHRIAIAHFSYNNIFLNGGFTAVGLVLSAAALLMP